MRTPWGQSDHVKPIGQSGMKFVETPSHGGIYVPPKKLATMPVELRTANRYSGSGSGFFEEDVEWALPVLAFPEDFSEQECDAAVKTVEQYADLSDKRDGDYLKAAVQWLAGPGGDAVKAKAAGPDAAVLAETVRSEVRAETFQLS